MISNLQKRVNVKRFIPHEGDSIKLRYIRTMIQALKVQDAILKDIEIDAIKQEFEEVRELVKNQSCYQGSIKWKGAMNASVIRKEIRKEIRKLKNSIIWKH